MHKIATISAAYLTQRSQLNDRANLGKFLPRQWKVRSKLIKLKKYEPSQSSNGCEDTGVLWLGSFSFDFAPIIGNTKSLSENAPARESLDSDRIFFPTIF